MPFLFLRKLKSKRHRVSFKVLLASEGICLTFMAHNVYLRSPLTVSDMAAILSLNFFASNVNRRIAGGVLLDGV